MSPQLYFNLLPSLTSHCSHFRQAPIPIKMTLCKFYARGFCKNGDHCNFVHEPDTSTGKYGAPDDPVLSSTEKLNHSSSGTTATHPNEEVKPAQSCRFFSQGKCNKGEGCWYSHLPNTVNSQPAVHPEAPSVDSSQSPADSRATVLCSFALKS
ncbi:hypothetical protein BJ878DRAFT_507093 [Calycina marina]|uniref:C3H1-type domain-containing protein n=1 Tax=Calycina marina TaxID=1763456 RepID=A0A9P7Z2C2_9HELO|nr:hypothetical protein BJ878DRAFT_507093 [Calycina marina]